MVVLESTAAGLPTIASGILGIKSAFAFNDRKDLVFVKPQDPKDLREKIQILLTNIKYASKLGQDASNFVKNNYTTQNLAKRLAGFIETV